MSAQIDFRTLPANVPVLCIPRVYPNISESRIRRIFNDLDMGELARIDMVSKTNDKGEKFNRVFIHYRRWNNSDNANATRDRLLNGKDVKIIYDEPWFWKITAYRPSTHHSGSRRQPSKNARKPTIAFDSDDEKPKEIGNRRKDMRRNNKATKTNAEEVTEEKRSELRIEDEEGELSDAGSR